MAREHVDGRSRDTRRRILNTARSEIVKYGVAGASINRISQEAGTSKERVYKYFKNKLALVEEVAKERMLERDAAVSFYANDLLVYVGSLFDFFAENPDDVRLFHWLILEADQESLAPDDPRIVSLAERITQVRRAQEEGLIDAYWDPLMLLNLLVSIAMAWATAPIFVHRVGAPVDTKKKLGECREAAQEAARRLIET